MLVDGEGYDAAPYLLGYEGKYGKSVLNLVRRYSANHAYFMLAHDDMVFYTPGWDQKIISVFETVGENIIVSGEQGVAPTISRGMLMEISIHWKALEKLEGVNSVWRFFADLPMNFHTQVDFGIDRFWKSDGVTAVEKEWLQADGDLLNKEVRAYAISLRRQRNSALPR